MKKSLKVGARVRIDKQVMVIGGRLGVVVRPRHFTERRFVAVKLLRRLKNYQVHIGEAWLVDRSMLKRAL